ncbi:filamentous hemagglutinin N-terminal domain-containing protein [Suttonella ornithocola]|nr:filamentous hemagglutinin N-terminal domain-containing protein [Suttonella ornithocola]
MRKRTADFHFLLNTLSWRFMLLLGSSLYVVPISHAYIVADNNAVKFHQPQVLVVGKDNIPQIDIQTPSKAGVSLNEYRQFDVDKTGAILNNSRKHSITQIAGWVPANPNLIKGEAKVIVNQINSSDPSQLNGYIEVAGKRADVIIANPAGIEVNGSGFINSAQTTLSTGKVLNQNGDFQGHDIASGKIHIQEKGIDLSQSDYSQLLAEQIKLDGPIYANGNKLDVITGKNQVDRQGNVRRITQQVTSVTSALDSSKLGGMYADSIRLISTEDGVGINHAGHIAASGQLTLSADGKLKNQGIIQSQTQIIQVPELDNQGQLSAAGLQTIDTHQLQNTGLIGASERLTLHSIDANNQGKIQAGALRFETDRLQNSGVISQTGSGSFELNNHNLSNSGHIGKPTISYTSQTSISIGDSKNVTESGWLKVKTPLHNQGEISANGEFSITATGNLNNDGSLTPDHLRFSGTTLKNSGVIRTQTSALTGIHLKNSGDIESNLFKQVKFNHINNTGAIHGHSSYQVEADTLENRGQLSSIADLEINASTQANNSGAIVAEQRLAIHTPQLTNEKTGQIRGAVLQLEGKTLHNQGTIAQTSDNALNIETPTLVNHGKIGQNDTTNTASAPASKTNSHKLPAEFFSHNSGFIKQAQIENSGQLLSLGASRLAIHQNLDNDGKIQVSQFDYTAEKLSNHGYLHADTANITAKILDNRQGILSADKFSPLSFSKGFDNTHGKIQSQQDLELTVNHLDHQSSDSLIASQSDLKINTSHIDNEGQLFSGKTLTLNSQHLNNKGFIQAEEKLNAKLQTLDNSAIIRAATLNIHSAQLNNSGILAQTGLGKFFISSKDLNNQKNAVLGKPLDIQSTIAGNNANATSPNHSNSPSSVPSKDEDGQLTIGQSLENQGRITANGDSYLEVSGQFHNQGSIGLHELSMQRAHFENEGTLYADIADLSGQTLLNKGKLQADQFKQFNYQNSIDNQGIIAGKHSFNIQTAKLNNLKGATLYSGKTLTLEAQQIHNVGAIHAQEQLQDRDKTRLIDNQGQISAGNILTLNTQTLKNQGDGILASQEMNLENQHVKNEGTIQGKNLTVKNQQTQNKGKVLFSNYITFTDDALINSGQIVAGNYLQAKQKSLENQGILQSKSIEVSGDNLKNQGIIDGQDALKIEVEYYHNHQQGVMQSVQGHLNLASKQQNNEGTILAKTIASHAETLNNTGTIAAENQLHHESETIHNQGNLVAGALELSSTTLQNSGQIRQIGQGKLQIEAQQLNNESQATIGRSLTPASTSTAHSSANFSTLPSTPANAPLIAMVIFIVKSCTIRKKDKSIIQQH